MLVISTCPADSAPGLARTLVEEKLVACVNVIPGVRSVYWWEGAVEEGEEEILLLKTRPDLVEDLRVRLQELHPYEVPEMIAFRIEDGLPAYLDWIRQVTRANG